MSKGETKSLYKKGDSSPSPLLKRMKSLERRELFYQAGFLLLIIGVIAVSAASILKPDIPILIDYKTGVLRGYYRTSAHRPIKDMEAGALRFLDQLLSYNSNTVERDQYEAMMLMTAELRAKREKYLFESNFVAQTRSSGIRSHNEYNPATVLYAKGDVVRFEVTGKVIFDNIIDEDVEDQAKNKPIHMILDAKMTEISPDNRLGLIIEDYYEYK